MNSWPRSSCVCRFDENDRITWALRSSVLDAIACILHLIFPLRAQTFLDTRYPGRYRHPLSLSLSVFLFFLSWIAKSRISEPAIAAHGPLLSMKRSINVCGRSFPVHLSPGSYSTPIFVHYFSRVRAFLTLHSLKVPATSIVRAVGSGSMCSYCEETYMLLIVWLRLNSLVSCIRELQMSELLFNFYYCF